MIKNARVVVILMVMASVWFPGHGFSESKNAGFYAGPLSAVAEVIIEVKVQKAVSGEDPKRKTQILKSPRDQGSEMKKLEVS